MKNKTLLLAIICIFIVSISASYASDVSDTSKNKSSQIKSSSNSKVLAAGDVEAPTKLSQDSISNASEYVNKYVSKNGRLPNSVTISNYKFSMPEFMYLLAKTVEYKHQGFNSGITVKYNVNTPTGPVGDNIRGTISAKNIHDYTTRVANFIIDEGTAPNFVTTTLGRMQYQQTIYSFIKILEKVDDGKFPKSVAFNFNKNSKINKYEPKFKRANTLSNLDDEKTSSSSSLNNLSGKSGLSTLQKYMNKKFNHRSGGSSSAAGLERTGTGDCWGLAEWAAKKLSANGYVTRIVQGASSSSSRHRWVQVRLDGGWVNFESSLITKKYGSKHYSKTCARVSTIVKYL